VSEPPRPARTFGAGLDDRIADWYAELTWRRGSTVITPDATTWILLSPEWPRSYANNGILLRADPGADALVAWGEEYLGGAGLAHRHVFALCDLSEQTRDGLTAAGYQVEPELVMARPSAAGPLEHPDGVTVELVDAEVVEPLHRRLWIEEWLPDAEPETVEHLVARRASYPRSGEMLTYVVRDPGSDDPVATLDVCVAGWAGEIDGVATLASHRRRGYGEAMLADALAAIDARGCEYAALTALVDDWPRHWYARRGFAHVADCWTATKAPEAVPS
jgi:ribosomal protein S18 acetylase RimI-like enzyme